MRNYLKTFLTAETRRQFARVFLIGILNTALYFMSSNLFKFALGWPTALAVLVAFVLGSMISYLLNRRWSFGLRGVKAGESMGFLVVNVVALLLTEVIVAGTEVVVGDLGPLAFNALNALAALVIIIPKFAAYRDVVFRKALAGQR